MEWEREPGHWLWNAGQGTSLILTAMTAVQNRGKKIPEMRPVGCPLLQKVTKPRGLQELSWSRISARFWWDTSTCCSGALQNPPGPCAWAGPHFLWVLLQVELLFSHQHKGQVKPDSAMSPPGFCSISRPPEQGCCCVSPRLPCNHREGLLCGLLPSYFQCTFVEGKKKKSCFLRSQDSSCWEDVIRAIVTGGTKAGDKVRPRFFPSEMSD